MSLEEQLTLQIRIARGVWLDYQETHWIVNIVTEKDSDLKQEMVTTIILISTFPINCYLQVF
jgi:hypothetical protein